jgi:hypothetical protein
MELIPGSPCKIGFSPCPFAARQKTQYYCRASKHATFLPHFKARNIFAAL